jgi:Thiamine pyrophosphate-requiring enzymes [acetolactate synthase, pyruvate dehydrogenase (cytochrome), glyoxylate carboligase, phosphonopyruvate decarboxylase]
MKIRVADYIMQHLTAIGADTVYMLSGGGMMHLVDAVGKCTGMKYVCNHHEQASAIAADAHARVSGKLGVCLATSGPGATNILTGLVGAWQDSSPVLFLTGQSKTTQTIQATNSEGLRQFGTFEVDIVPIVKSVTKYSVMVTDPSTIRYHLEKAIFIAQSGRPGPVLIDMPLDIQGALIEPELLEGYKPEVEDYTISNDVIEKIKLLISNAKRPLIMAGVGVRRAESVDLLKQLATTWNIPVVVTQLGKDVLPYDSEFFVGHPGPKGDRAANFAVQTADVIIAIGCSLHSQTTGWENDLFAPQAIKIQVDLDQAVLKREKVSVDIKVVSDVTTFIKTMMNEIRSSLEIKPWLEKCAYWKKQYAVMAEPHERPDSVVNYYDVAEQLSLLASSHATIVTDAGSAFYVMGQAYRINAEQKFISSGSLGAMGFAIPAATGAAVATGKQVICVTGDGSMMTNVHELATIKKENLDVKIIIVNNGGYLSIRNTQDSFFNGNRVGADDATGVFIPSVEKLTSAFELPYFRCSDPSLLSDVLTSALSMTGPCVVEVISMPDQKIIPSVTSVKLADGRMQSKPLHDMYPFMSEQLINDEIAISSNNGDHLQ